MDDRRQLYDRIPCSTQAVDGALRGALVGAAWALITGERQAGTSLARAMGRDAGVCGGALFVYHLSHCTLNRRRPPNIPPWHVSLAAGAITGGMGALFTVQPPRTAVAITLGSAACAALLDRIMSSDIVFT